MNFEEHLQDFFRKPVWLLKLHLDQCALTNGVPPCQAEPELVNPELIQQLNKSDRIIFGPGPSATCKTIGQSFLLTSQKILYSITVDIKPVNQSAVPVLKLYKEPPFYAEQLNYVWNNYFQFGNSTYCKAAQTFTINSDTIIKKITLKLGKYGSPTDSVRCAIYGTQANGEPNLDDLKELSSTIINASQIPSHPNLADFDFQFNCPLEPGLYAFVLYRTDELNASHWFKQAGQFNSNPYSGGIWWQWLHNESKWEKPFSGVGNCDAYFKIYGKGELIKGAEQVNNKFILDQVLEPKSYYFEIEITQAGNPLDDYNYYAEYSPFNPYANGMMYQDEIAQANKDLYFIITLAQEIYSSCYYTYSTCRDLTHYTRSEYVWKFSSRDYQVSNSLPFLKKVSYLPIEIDAKYNLARRGEVILELSDDQPLYYVVLGKSRNKRETGGRFWRNLLARNPNYYHRLVEVYLGFEGLKEEEFRLFFRGLLERIELQESGVVLSVKDLLKSLDRLSHPRAGDGCKLAQDYSGGETLKVYQGEQLLDWGILKSEGGKYVKFSGKTGPDGNGVWTLKNANFCFGSSGVIEQGKKIKSVLVYARDNDGIDEGFSPDWILLDLLCERGKIKAEYLEMVDSGAVLSEDLSESEDRIPVSNSVRFPDQGVVKIDDELIIYRGKEGNNLVLSGPSAGAPCPLFYQHFRGAFGTQAQAHNSGAPIYLPKISAELMKWLGGARFRAEIEEPKKIQELLNQICEQALIQCWQNEASKIDFCLIGPPQPGSAVKELNDAEHLLENSVSVWDDRELQASRVLVYYKPLSPDPEPEPKSYQSVLVEIEEEIENENWLAEEKPKVFFANWIYRTPEASALASRHLLRYKQGARQVKFQLELKDLDLEVGKLFWLKTRQILNEKGEQARLLFQVLRKQFRSLNRIEFQALETRLHLRYAYLGPEEPALKETIGPEDTVICLALSEDSYQSEDFAESGEIQIEEEEISYGGKSYEPETKILTLSSCLRGIHNTTPSGHNSGVPVLLFYSGASQRARDKYAWVSDEKNLLDSDGDAQGDQEGFYIY